MKKFLYILLAFLAIACKQESVPAQVADGKLYFGEKINETNAIDISESVVGFEKGEKRTVKIKGTIESICQAKGCWMTLQKSGMDETVFIKFKDYAFFVPKDADGKDAIVKGKLYASVTSVDELRHYAEDKGASAEEIAAIIEPEREIKMMADGVIIYN